MEIQEVALNEKPREYPNLRFEPGEHIGGNAGQSNPSSRDLVLDIQIRTSAGDPDAHAWPKEVVARILETQPEILALDGLQFSETFNFDKLMAPPKLGPQFPENVWIVLPARPEEINPSGKSVFVVNGDDTYLGEPFNVPLLTHPQGKDLQVIREALNSKIREDNNRSTQDFFAETYALMAAARLVDIAIGGNILWNKIRRNVRVISRRNFLKGAAALTATVATGAYFQGRLESQYRAGQSSTEVDKDFWLDVVHVVEPKVIKAQQVNMRTAMLILKTKDAMDKLALPAETAAAILMGSGHSFNAQDFLASDKDAQRAIRDYINSIDPIIRKVLQQHPVITHAQVIDDIKSLLAQTFVLKVDEPDHKSFHTPGLNLAIEEATSTVADFKSPRVEATFID